MDSQNQNALLQFLQILELEVIDTDYGTMNVSVVINNGVPLIESTTIAKQKRKKYSNKQQTVAEEEDLTIPND
jgi:ribosomal protein S3